MNRFLGIALFVLLLAPGIVGAQTTGTTPPKAGETTQGQYVPLTGIPFITQDLMSDGCRDGGDPANCETNLGTVFQGVIIFLIGAGGILAVGYFMWGAIQYMTQDIPSLKQNGREKMLAAVGGLVAVLAAFTLLQTIAPGISDSIKNFNDYLKPVNPPDCLGSATGCLNAQGEGTFNTTVTGSATEGVPDTPSTSTGNAGERIVQSGKFEFLTSLATNNVKYDPAPIKALETKCQGIPDARKDSATLSKYTGNVQAAGFTALKLHVCFSPFEIDRDPPVQEEQVGYKPSDDLDFVKASAGYKAFAASCEKDWGPQFSAQIQEIKKGLPEGGGVTTESIKGQVKFVRGVGAKFSGNAGKYDYYLRAIFVCSLTGF